MRSYCLGKLAAIGLATLVATAASSIHDGGQKGAGCNATALAKVLPANAKIQRIEAVEAGSTYGDGEEDDLNYPIQPTNLPALCAVTVEVTSSNISSYRVGIFLPVEWNNRFLATGNGGFGGGINWIDMGAGAQYGFAVTSTDTGHNSKSTDVAWALDNPGSKIDWGWRAIHGSVTIGKLITEAHYGHPSSYSYYSGCSTGGRQGLKEIQKFPDSFDGVLVGSPAWYTSHLNMWAIQVATYNWPEDEPKHIPWELLPELGTEILKQCDDIDGAADGIVSLPGLCDVDLGKLLCDKPGANQSACVTEAQAQTLKNVYSDWKSSSGELLYTGLSPGSEAQMYTVLNYSESSGYGINYARYFVLDNASFAFQDFNESVALLAQRTDPGNPTADKYDLADFRDRGGKMLMYHGAADGLVPFTGSNLYYNRVVDKMGGNLTATRDFFKYFQVPGMQHCYNTPVDAPWAFGGSSQASTMGNDTWSVPGFKDAKHDILLALIDWVEKNVTVDQIVATTWNEPTNITSGVLKQRPICPYPEMARWDGEGDINDAQSWSCGGNVHTRPSSTPAPTSEAQRLWWESGVALVTILAVILSWIVVMSHLPKNP